MKSLIMIVALGLVGTMVNATESAERRLVERASLNLVVLNNMLATSGQSYLGSRYFSSKDRICMRVGAIGQSAVDLSLKVDFLKRGSQDDIRDYGTFYGYSQKILDLAAALGTYCGGLLDGADDQHTGFSGNSRTLKLQAEVHVVSEEILQNAKKILQMTDYR